MTCTTGRPAGSEQARSALLTIQSGPSAVPAAPPVPNDVDSCDARQSGTPLLGERPVRFVWPPPIARAEQPRPELALTSLLDQRLELFVGR
jgi:hypothetical protein